MKFYSLLFYFFSFPSIDIGFLSDSASIDSVLAFQITAIKYTLDYKHIKFSLISRRKKEA